MTNPSLEYAQRPILSDFEIDHMIEEADKIPFLCFKLRAKALIAIAKTFGKRRSEIARIEMAAMTQG